MADHLEQLIPANVRVLVERTRSGQWQAFSLEFGLAAQGESLREVRQKILEMVNSYLDEALTVDRAHAPKLLRRKSSLGVIARFKFVYTLSKLHVSFKKLGLRAQASLEPTSGMHRCHG